MVFIMAVIGGKAESGCIWENYIESRENDGEVYWKRGNRRLCDQIVFDKVSEMTRNIIIQ